MKNTGQCAKCGAGHVVRIEGRVGAYGAGNNIFYGWLFTSAVKVTRYLCASCGFSEEWIDDPDDIARLVQKYGGHK